jgi:hypothetical protein
LRGLRLLTINTWHGHVPRGWWAVERIEPEGHKERRTAALLTAIRELDPDVIFLQECVPQPTYSQELAATLSYDHILKICNSGVRLLGVGLPTGIGSGEGLAIFAKPHLELRAAGVRRLSGFGVTSVLAAAQLGQLRFALAGEIRLEGKRVILVTTHLRYTYPDAGGLRRSWDELSRTGEVQGQPPHWLTAAVHYTVRLRDREVLRLAELVSSFERQGVPVIVGADLNLDDDTAQVRRFTESLGMLNVLPAVNGRAWTWDPEGNPNIAFSTTTSRAGGSPKSLTERLMAHYDAVPQCPDHLLLGPTFPRGAIADAGLAFHRARGDVYPSDHYAVFCEIRGLG